MEETKKEEMEELELLDKILIEGNEPTLDLLQKRQIRNLDSMVAVMSMSTKEPGFSTDVTGGEDCANILIWVYRYLQWLKMVQIYLQWLNNIHRYLQSSTSICNG